MKKSMKKILSVVCSLMLVVAAMPVFNAFAAGTTASGSMGKPDGVDEADFTAKVEDRANWTFTAPEGKTVDYSGTTITYSANKVTLTFADGIELPTRVAFSAAIKDAGDGVTTTKVYKANSNIAQEVDRKTNPDSPVTTNVVDMTLSVADAPVDNSQDQIRGYQTELLNTYAIDVYFDATAVYCYNRGEYNPTTEKYEVKQGTEKYNNYAEKGITATGAVGSEVYDVTRTDDNGTDGKGNKFSGRWFGFDGTQNLIVVVNRSTAGVKCKTTSSVNSDIFKGNEAGNQGAIELFKGTGDWYTQIGLKANSDATDGNDGSTAWKLADFTGNTFTNALDSPMAKTARKKENVRFGDATTDVSQAGSGEQNVTTCNGVESNMPSVTSFYYNIKGRPELDLSSTGDNKFKTTAAEKIGTITLAFTAAA